ncbi:class I SAM-dependent methyltransferase [Hymenobacter sp. BT635]|uniref:Class I SAM-dependent methyltransferase n=1 Tax=Hymenobacter nitidus TaxID=2880929 RepID=A0ABS8AI20_9BACT|nr:class I SAM-dependent methyltransferase [Hymenobacter nitidus]MCB2378639.1 class I SAM-dependent methyltransferase [Hymenobacter nitidus]
MNMFANSSVASKVQPAPHAGSNTVPAPRKTLVATLRLLEPTVAPRLALDLGCGSGPDTLELLSHNWDVVALDANPEALATLLTQTPAHQMAQLTTRLMDFAELQAASLPEFDLVNASFSIPYCLPRHFHPFWAEVRQLIRRRGWFCGHFFGLRDDASQQPDMMLHSLADIYDLFTGFELEMLSGVEKDKVQPDGSVKHSHVVSVIARKC